MFCSTIIPTIGRNTLNQAIESVLAQSIDQAEFEIIVVNDSGKQLQVEYWQSLENITIINTNRRERSVARNTGASVAKGAFLHFLDDDDWLAPGALQQLWNLSQSSKAKWLYGSSQLVDRKHQPTIQLKHGMSGNRFLQVMSGEWVPLQASIIEREAFFRIGGFNPLLAGPEDVDLLRRFLLEENIEGTSELVAYIVLGEIGSTTDYYHHPQASRWAREIILDKANVYDRMRSSTLSPYWYGRMARIYLTSTLWNLRQGLLFKAASRFFYSLASLVAARSGLFSPHFWHSVFSPYESLTFEKGIQEARKAPKVDL